jgi:carbon monoxide dehydrogenase subunit G
MEHEAFVPVPTETLRQVLRDPARVSRCLPGLQQDADESAGPLSGRLRVRISGHTITYRGTLRIVEQGDVFVIEGEGVEARGTGSAKVTLAIRPAAVEGGTTLSFTGTSRAEGRLAELADTATTSAAHRLLDRFADGLATAVAEEPPSAVAASEDVGGPGAGRPGGPGAGEGAEDEGSAQAEADASTSEALGAADAAKSSADADADADASDEAPKPAVFDVPEGPEAPDVSDVPDASEPLKIPELPDIHDELAAEAAHARRTMIGRSAEEVDHAPPRGRYAPVPPPGESTAGATLRWLAPAAALAFASAVVVQRMLRRRK